jgi:hypothetical protein
VVRAVVGDGAEAVQCERLALAVRMVAEQQQGTFARAASLGVVARSGLVPGDHVECLGLPDWVAEGLEQAEGLGGVGQGELPDESVPAVPGSGGLGGQQAWEFRVEPRQNGGVVGEDGDEILLGDLDVDGFAVWVQLALGGVGGLDVEGNQPAQRFCAGAGVLCGAEADEVVHSVSGGTVALHEMGVGQLPCQDGEAAHGESGED